MEEAMYKRQVAKISMSKRVIDAQQIDRHFKRDDLCELYSTKNIDPKSEKDNTIVPNDTVLAKQFIEHKHILYNYHSHDSLLQSNEEDNLSHEEQQQAWSEFKSERSHGKSQNSSLFRCLQIGK